LATVVGVTLGVLAALRHGSWLDTAAMTFAILGVSMPVFYSSLLMILLFSFTLGWLPATGQGGVERLIMPATALGLISSAVLARLVRSGMLGVLRQEYIVTARAKGLAPGVVVLRHALKNALIPTITMLGLQLGALLGPHPDDHDARPPARRAAGRRCRDRDDLLAAGAGTVGR
jgi:ABC-type dipeptide/oligopeptide/nickel transport system permease component